MNTAMETKPGMASDPFVIVDFVFDRGLLSIAVKNIGTLPAYDVQVDFSEKIKGLDGTVEISELPLFRDLAFLPGGKEITTLLATSTSYFQLEQPTQIKTCISWRNLSGDSIQTTIRHNLEIYREIGYILKNTSAD
jgi:hypothetical protein